MKTKCKRMAIIVSIAFVAMEVSGCEFLSGFMGMDDVTMVKSGILELDKSTTVGQAVDKYKYFTQVTWEKAVTENGRRIVTFTGEMGKEALTAPDGLSEVQKAIWENELATLNETYESKLVGYTIIQQFIINQDDTFMLGWCGAIPKFDPENDKTLQSRDAELKRNSDDQKCINIMKKIYQNNRSI